MGFPVGEKVGAQACQGWEVRVCMACRLRREEARESFASRGKRYFRAVVRSFWERRATYGDACFVVRLCSLSGVLERSGA